ncbi:MAG: hypothetical protein ACI4RI_03525 [Ruminococcus sp.]
MSEPKYVFICSPYRNNPAYNTEMTREACRQVALNTSYIPLAPHLYFTSFLKDEIPEERNKGIESGLKWLEKSFIVLAIKNEDGISEGMMNEMDYAKKLSKPIMFFESYYQFFDIISNSSNIVKVIDSFFDSQISNPCINCRNNHPHLLGCNGRCDDGKPEYFIQQIYL